VLAAERTSTVSPWQGWLPWAIVSIVVIVWTLLKIANIGQQAIHWPGLDKAISITLYHGKPYAAIWAFQPLTTGTAILVAAIITGFVTGISLGDFFRCIGTTIRQIWVAVVTVIPAWLIPWASALPRPGISSSCSRRSWAGSR
jgi:lactate permease